MKDKGDQALSSEWTKVQQRLSDIMARVERRHQQPAAGTGDKIVDERMLAMLRPVVQSTNAYINTAQVADLSARRDALMQLNNSLVDCGKIFFKLDVDLKLKKIKDVSSLFNRRFPADMRDTFDIYSKACDVTKHEKDKLGLLKP